MFRVKDENFDIKYAYLDAFTNSDEELVFGLYIKAEEKNSLFSGNDLYFNSEIMLKFKANEIKKWQDIAGKIIEWDDPEDEEEPRAIFYVYEHEEVYNAKVEFKNINNKIIVKIEALCNIYAGDEFSDNLPLEIETEIDFFGIACGKDTTEEECINEIKPYLDVDNLQFVQNKYNVSFMVPKNTNMETNLLVLGEY